MHRFRQEIFNQSELPCLSPNHTRVDELCREGFLYLIRAISVNLV